MKFFIVRQTAYYLVCAENEQQAAVASFRGGPPLYFERELIGEGFESPNVIEAYQKAHEAIAKARRAMTDNRFRWLVLRSLRFVILWLVGLQRAKPIVDELEQGEQALERDGL